MYTDGAFLEQSGGTWYAEHSPWKARQVVNCIRKNRLQFRSVVDIGCGSGVVLSEMCTMLGSGDIQYSGYDISPQAIKLSKQLESNQLRFFCGDFFESDAGSFDLLLALDVFEHIPDYLGFLTQCQAAARYKIYHIPLDISVQTALRGTVGSAREDVGHLHYFTAETALETLQYTGHKVIDSIWSEAWRCTTQTSRQAGSLPFRTGFANVFRIPLGKISIP